MKNRELSKQLQEYAKSTRDLPDHEKIAYFMYDMTKWVHESDCNFSKKQIADIMFMLNNLLFMNSLLTEKNIEQFDSFVKQKMDKSKPTFN